MISKFLSKLKSSLFKSAVSSETPLKKDQNLPKPSKSKKTKPKTKPKTKAKAKPKAKPKTKTVNSKKNIETLTTLPGVGAKSAKALYEAGFKTKKAIIAADEKDLLAVSGVGINLVKKLKDLK